MSTGGSLTTAGAWPRRLAVTVLLILAFALGRRIPIPWFVLDEVAPAGTHAIGSLFALGVRPVLSAYLLVELAALSFPKWQALRHQWPEGRAALERKVVVLAVALAGFQAFGMVLMVEGMAEQFPVLTDSNVGWLLWLTWVAGTCLTIWLVRTITQQGLVHGLIALNLLQELGDEPARKPADPLGALASLPVLAMLATITLATLLVLNESRRGVERASAGGSATGESWVPTPAAPVQALQIASGLLLLPTTLSDFGLEFMTSVRDWLATDETWVIVEPLLVLAAGCGLAFALQSPWLVARFRTGSSELDSDIGERAREDAATALSAAFPATAAFLLCLLFAHWTGRQHGFLLALLIAPCLAFVIDFVTALGIGISAPNLRCAWEERRTYAIPRIQSLLAADGIEAHLSGLNQLVLHRIFAPFLAVRVWVASDQVERAQTLIRERLLEAPAPSDTPPERKPSSEKRPSPVVAGLLALAAAATFLLARLPASDTPAAPAPIVSRVSLQVVLVDDEPDPFASVELTALPPGGSLFDETLPAHSGLVQQRNYLRLLPVGGESLAAAARRVEPWLATIQLPAGDRFALGPLNDEALRTYVLRGEPIITGADIVHAQAKASDRGEAYVAIELSASGGAQFAAATRNAIDHRLAIVIDGQVHTAPVVKAEIGSSISISMGRSNDPARDLADAQRLAAALGAPPLAPSPAR